MVLGFSASVFIDDKPLPEYKIVESRTEEENRMTCWIPSEAGKKFEIRGEILEPQYPGIKVFAFVDGRECPSWVVHPPWTGTLEYNCISNETTRRELMFKKIELTDDDSMLNNYSGDIGQIVMKLERGTYTKVRKAKLAGSSGHNLDVHEDKVHERLKKGRDHQVGFCEEVPDQEEQTTYISDLDECPVTVFIFNYTSLDNLRAMNIVPQMSNPPIPVDGPSDGQSSSMDMRIRELELELQRLRAIQATRSSSSGDQKPSRVKLEPAVIDLTDD
ncbi:hypothetical protein F4604DRAFT_1707879 [Suillus subluteus]|nr:hypothetical protein F4604DRAFT_1707879 [Suillus subluteus]